jgi:chemotaxis protein methyltransferase CheR
MKSARICASRSPAPAEKGRAKTMRLEDFDLFAQVLKEQSGLVLTKDKVYLLESRLMPIARKRNLKSLDDLAQALRTGRDTLLVKQITEAMTTNESSFFRDQKPFDQLKAVVLPEMMKARADTKTIRIWSAACSSGQEAYSIAITLKEMGVLAQGWRFEIVGTDLSEEMVERARSGAYSQFEVQRGLPVQMLVKYFKQNGDKWEISPELRSMAQFRPYNLLTDLKPLGRFDIVFCRNVLIYFDQATKGRVLAGIAAQMPPDGRLYLGGAETVLGITDKFKLQGTHRGLYQLAEAPAGGAASPGFGFGAGLGAPKPAAAAPLPLAAGIKTTLTR